MCANFFDVRAFGAVMSTGINCGQVRGPLQFVFGRSVEAIMPLEISITRMAATNEAEKKKRTEGADDDKRGDNPTTGRKHIVPYGLYRVHAFVNAKLAQKTGFSAKDLELIKQALGWMYELDRSAARGEMAARRCIAFRHDSDIWATSTPTSYSSVSRCIAYSKALTSALATSAPITGRPRRSFPDYDIRVDSACGLSGIHVEEWVQ